MSKEITIPEEVLKDLMKKVDNETFANNYIKLLKQLFDEKTNTEIRLRKLEIKIDDICKAIKRIDTTNNAGDFASIENIGFSPRAYNCLRRANINTIGDMIQRKNDIATYQIRDLGKNSTKEILEFIRGYENHHKGENND